MPARGDAMMWPPRSDVAAWEALANAAMQAATFEADVQENRDWEATMRALLAEQLDYEEFTHRRMEALRERLRRRKLTQQNLRYRYGFHNRNPSNVRLDVKRYLRQAMARGDWF